MNPPSTKQLKYLRALAEHRHFGRAAEACYVSQSALSTGINELENNLGVVLFERGSKVFVTPIGLKLVEEAQQILTLLDNFVEHAAQARGDFQSDLRLGVIPTIAPFLLPRLLKVLRKRGADQKLYIREDLSPNLLNMLANGDLDILLFALPYNTLNFHTHRLFDDELVLCLPKSHVLSNKEAISVSDLKTQNLLLLEDGHCLRDQSLKACNLNSNDLSIPYQATSLNTLVQMVANNIGMTLLPEMATRANITHDTDAQIRYIKTNRNMRREIALVWRNNSPRKAEFESLAELIMELQ